MYGLATHVVDGAPPVFHVAGDIDMANADEFSKDLKDALSAHPTLVLDMAEVTFLDAAGLRVIYANQTPIPEHYSRFWPFVKIKRKGCSV